MLMDLNTMKEHEWMFELKCRESDLWFLFLISIQREELVDMHFQRKNNKRYSVLIIAK